MSNDGKSILENTELAHHQSTNYKCPKFWHTSLSCQETVECKPVKNLREYLIKIGSNLWAVGNKELISIGLFKLDLRLQCKQ
jgi:hypothetical protein